MPRFVATTAPVGACYLLVYTLFLDSGYQPMAKRPWREAVLAYISGRAEIISSFDIVVHPLSGLKMPSIVRMHSAVVAPAYHLMKFSKYNVWVRDNRQCQYCDKPLPSHSFDLEHVIPKHRGGRTCWTNVVASCKACNQRKGPRTPQEAGMRLRVEPTPPTWSSYVYDNT
jgi:5-methylcytosine-specific restriction endonuclease McrA